MRQKLLRKSRAISKRSKNRSKSKKAKIKRFKQEWTSNKNFCQILNLKSLFETRKFVKKKPFAKYSRKDLGLLLLVQFTYKTCMRKLF